MKVHMGEGVAPGTAVGAVHLRGFGEAEGYAPRIPSDQVENELNRLREALSKSRQQIEDIKERQRDKLGQSELRIFDTHIAYLSDSMFLSEIEKLVMHERYTVRTSINNVVENYDRIFQLVENETVRQRAGDLRDVAMRLLNNLEEGEPTTVDESKPKGLYILAARTLTTADMFDLENVEVAGIVAEEGGISSHAAILARGMGIPTITGIRDLAGKLENGVVVVVDAGGGRLLVDPDEESLADAAESAEHWRDLRHQVPREDIPHETRDGTAIEILSACGNVGEVELSRTFGMPGVGLFRTELKFLSSDDTPDEEDLVEHYREVINQPEGQPVDFRLLDVTARAGVPGLPHPAERNPALGLRGIRSLLWNGQVLRLQLRAILRAAAGRTNVGILIPYASSVNELKRVKSAILEERSSLKKRNIPHGDSLNLAPIIEVPAAAFVLKAFLNESSHAVVAIDDLQAHVLGADRDNPAVREYYEMLHPALFELISNLAKGARRARKKLVLFGELAADPMRLPFYLGVGIRNFAVAPVRLTGMLKVLQRFTLEECKKIAEDVLTAPRALDVQRVLVRVAGS